MFSSGINENCEPDLKKEEEMDDKNLFVVKKENIQFENYGDFDREKAEIALIVSNKDNTLMEAGIFVFDTSFDYTLEADEIILVTEGCLVITYHEKQYEAGPGDYMFLKKGLSVNWGCRGKTAYFYATYPIGN